MQGFPEAVVFGKKMREFVLAQNDNQRHNGTLIIMCALVFLVFLWFAFNYKSSNNPTYLGACTLMVLLMIFVWSTLNTYSDLPEAICDEVLVFPLFVLVACTRAVFNATLIFLSFIIVCILINGQINESIVFHTIFTSDSWYIYPIICYVSEHLCDMVIGGQRVGGWLPKLMTFVNPMDRIHVHEVQTLGVAGVTILVFAVIWSVVLFSYKTYRRESHLKGQSDAIHNQSERARLKVSMYIMIALVSAVFIIRFTRRLISSYDPVYSFGRIQASIA